MSEQATTAAAAGEMVVLGRLADPYGIRGWLHLHPFGDDPLAWSKMASWWVGKEGGPWREYALSSLKAHGDGLVLLLEGVADRSAAESLKGLLVAAPRSALPATADDEYYWADLIGLAVVNEAGEALGRVAGLIETGANDVLRVLGDDGTERLLPFVDAVVLDVGRESGVIRVAWGLDW